MAKTGIVGWVRPAKMLRIDEVVVPARNPTIKTNDVETILLGYARKCSAV